jgi:hypothetical protein
LVSLKSAIWIHGNIVEVQFPERVNQRKFDWGTLYTSRGSPAENWFHFPIPTPVIVDDQRPPLSKVFVFYNARSAAITEVGIRDGSKDVKKFIDLNLSGDHSSNVDSANSWVIDPPTTIFFGLGISLKANIASPHPDTPQNSGIIFTTAGADFKSP